VMNFQGLRIILGVSLQEKVGKGSECRRSHALLFKQARYKSVYCLLQHAPDASCRYLVFRADSSAKRKDSYLTAWLRVSLLLRRRSFYLADIHRPARHLWCVVRFLFLDVDMMVEFVTRSHYLLINHGAK